MREPGAGPPEISSNEWKEAKRKKMKYKNNKSQKGIYGNGLVQFTIV